MAFSYELVTRNGAGHEHVRGYTSEEQLTPGSVVVLGGRSWLVESVDEGRVRARPARYRLTLRHPDAREEAGAFRRHRTDAPTLGHQLTTLERGTPVSWAVAEQHLVHDEAGEPFLELIAERDYAESESLPDHQLEHALERDDDGDAAATLARAEAAGFVAELVSLEPGEAPDWDEAARYLEALILEEINDHLLEIAGVDTRNAQQETWLDTVKQRLRDDLAAFRNDIEGDHDEIEEWDFRGGRVFSAIGRLDDEANPLSGYGWLSRLVDASVVGAAHFQRVSQVDLAP
jgi:hypothetical protein